MQIENASPSQTRFLKCMPLTQFLVKAQFSVLLSLPPVNFVMDVTFLQLFTF